MIDRRKKSQLTQKDTYFENTKKTAVDNQKKTHKNCQFLLNRIHYIPHLGEIKLDANL